MEERLGLTHKSPSYRPTGTHPSPRSVLEWRSAIRSTSLSSTSRPTLCTHWSLTANTAPPHWAVTRGRSWLVHRPRYSSTVTGKGSTPRSTILTLRGHALASLLIRKITAWLVTPESGLALEGIMMTPTLVETKQDSRQIMETSTSKPWATSWCSNKENMDNYFKHFKPCRM